MVAMVDEPVVKHPFASVMVTLYVPGFNPDINWVLAPFDHAYVYGAVPPVIIALIVPSAKLPEQVA